MRRLGVFQMYDPDGVVEDYITFLLDDICLNFSDFIVVVCGEIIKEQEKKLRKYTNRIFIRRNYGYDAYAFKETFLEYMDKDEIQQYDEIVLFNDTFYGPFYSFSQVFNEMEKSDSDFWGLTRHKENKEFRDHIQSYFLVLRKNIIKSDSFLEFWKKLELKEINFKHLGHNYEVAFTDYFDSKGFKYEAYVKDDALNSKGLNNYNHYSASPYHLIKYFKMPVIKRKTLTEKKNLYLYAGEEIQNAYNYIKDYYHYDTDMIWNDLLRKSRISDIKNNLNLNFILPDDIQTNHSKTNRKVVVIAHITYEELLLECLEYIKNIPRYIDVVITSYKDSILAKTEEIASSGNYNIKTMKVVNRGRDVASIFVACREIVSDYDYICFIHDKKTTGKDGMYPIGASFNYLVWDNLLKNTAYIERLISLLETEKKLGFLSPPKPLHWDYRSSFVDEWGVNYDKACEVAQKIGLKIKLDRDNQPFCLSTCFWCKREALELIWKSTLSYDDFPEEPCPMDGEINHAIERILVFVAQQAGYYSGIIENTEYASLDLQNRELWMKGTNYCLNARILHTASFIGRFSKIYVYGAGIEARKVKEILEVLGRSAEGYIVSDKYLLGCSSQLKPIISLNEVPQNGEVGIIVGMNQTNSDEVKPILFEREYKNLFFFNGEEVIK